MFNCKNSGKFKKIYRKNKIVIDNSQNYRYFIDLWIIPKKIAKPTNNKYIIDIVKHFNKQYYEYLLYTKNGEEVFKKIQIFIDNFGKPKILQLDNGREFDNKIINNYYSNN